MKQQSTYQAFREEQRRRELELMRIYGRLFRHWRFCRSAACRRARACAGEPVSCYRGWWRGLTEPQRDALRWLIRDGLAGRRGG